MERGGIHQTISNGSSEILFDESETRSPFFLYNNPAAFFHLLGDTRQLTGLKPGKPLMGMKRERPAAAVTRVSCSSSSLPSCQVEGCNEALVGAKDYHRRHKVCESHSKAPRVVVLGLEQRFCQQCSRFHVVSEFDESKRSCRRRLAGHNERRRKRFGESFDGTRALPLLSSSSSPLSVWASSDLSTQSSVALRELIAENRAATLTGQLFSGGIVFPLSAYRSPPVTQAAPSQPGEDGWNHLRGPMDGRVTLDLMQTPSSSFMDVVPVRRKSKDEDEECCEIWKSLEGTHVV